MAWYLAPSLENLRDEINARWPNRDKTSDGTIGDASHQSGSSDHNPNSRDSVNAIDIDKDGVDVNVLMDSYKNHPATHYYIWNRKIYDRENGFKPVDYHGDNPHDKHIHLSIKQSSSAENDKTPWGIEEQMTQSEFNTLFLNAIRSDTIGAELKAKPWQYVGGGIPANYSTLKVLNEVLELCRELREDVDKLLEIPPGTVTVPQDQLEDAVREVIGSVDEIESVLKK